MIPRIRNTVGLLLGVSMSLGVGGDRPVIAAEYALDDLVQALQNREAGMNRFSVDVVWEKRSDKLYGKEGTMSVICEQPCRGGRVRCEVTRMVPIPIADQPDAEPKIGQNRDIAVFDGKTVRWTTGLIGEDGEPNFSSGVISEQAETLPWSFDPRQAVSCNSGSSFSEYLTKYPIDSIETVASDQGDLVLVTMQPVKSSQARRSQIWISPEKGFAVVKRETQIQFEGRDEWLGYDQLSNSDFVEVAQGLWVPQECTLKGYFLSAENTENSEMPDPYRDIALHLSNWEVNPQVSEETFQLAFAGGVFVTNEITGETYQLPGIPAPIVDRNAKKAEVLDEKSSQNRGWLLYVNLGVLAVAIVVIAGVYLRRRKLSGA